MIRRFVHLVNRFIAVTGSDGLVQALRQTKDIFIQGALAKHQLTQTASRRGGKSLVSDFRISVLMPVYNTPADVLDAAIMSVVRQTYSGWELCICDDSSTSADTLQILERYRGADSRIKITRSTNNLHIARATNLAAEFATGDFVAFLDHDDTLESDAIETMVRAIEETPEADVLYSDEDKIEPNGTLSEPYLKPDWSPEHLLSVMYLLHFLVVRKSLFLEVGGLRHEFTGAQDYDLALRATDKARRVVHVPHVLYHWRKIPGSAAATIDAKPEALINAKRAVTDFVKNRHTDAEVSDGLFEGSFRVKWPVDANRRVTLLMLSAGQSREIDGRGRVMLVEHAVKSIVERSSFTNYKIIVVHGGNLPADVIEYFSKIGVQLAEYQFEGKFNYPDKLNFALQFVKTDDVILLNDDLEVVTNDWIEALLAFSRQPDIGAVGARLLYPNNRNQHAGVVLGVNGLSTHIFHNQPANQVGYCGFTHVIRNYSAVTGAVLATRMGVIRQVGALNPKLRVDYNDIDFCLRVREAGYRIVYTPHATLYHFEGSSLVRHAVDPADQAEFLARWGEVLENDPYYNPQLPRNRTDCAVTQW